MTIAELKREIKSCEEKMASKNNDINDLVRQVQLKDSVLYELQQKYTEHENHSQKSNEEKDNELIELKSKIQKFEERVQFLDTKLKDRNATINEDKAKIEELQSQLVTLTQYKEEVQVTLKDIQEKEASLSQENSTLKAQLEKIETQFSSHQEEKGSIEKLLEEKTEEINALQQWKEEKEAEIKVIERKNASLIKDLQKQLLKEKKITDATLNTIHQTSNYFKFQILIF